MSQTAIMLALLALVSAPAAAQRLDGCPTEPQASMIIGTPSQESIDQRLHDSAISLSRDALTTALSDPRADIRSLAALKLGLTGNMATLTPLVQAWLAEEDPCTKFVMEFGLGTLVPALAVDKKQHPNGQPWVKPFQACKESDRSAVTLSIEPMKRDSPAVRITARNNTDRTLPYVMAAPEELYSVTVLGPAGIPAKIFQRQESMFEPDKGASHLFFNGPTFVALPPHGEVPVWTWDVGNTFDLSLPGTYQVSLGGRIEFLDSTICSNTAEVVVQ
jgi:hypothetical protein